MCFNSRLTNAVHILHWGVTVCGVSWVQPMQANQLTRPDGLIAKKKNPMMFWWGKSRWHGQSVSSPRVFRVAPAVVTHTRHFFHAPPKNHGVNCSWLTIRLPHLTLELCTIFLWSCKPVGFQVLQTIRALKRASVFPFS